MESVHYELYDVGNSNMWVSTAMETQLLSVLEAITDYLVTEETRCDQ